MTFVLHTPQPVQSRATRRSRYVELRPCVYRLTLAPVSILYPYSAGQMEWSGDELRLTDGVYYADTGRYLAVEGERGGSITEAQALVRLGAVEALLKLDLGDAAISLQVGDLTNARYQWLRYRDGR